MDRKEEAGLVQDGNCPHCGLASQDGMHMIWTCPKLETREDPKVRKTNYPKGRATKEGEHTPCLRLRGIVPSWRAFGKPVELGESHMIEDIPPEHHFNLNGKVVLRWFRRQVHQGHEN